MLAEQSSRDGSVSHRMMKILAVLADMMWPNNIKCHNYQPNTDSVSVISQHLPHSGQTAPREMFPPTFVSARQRILINQLGSVCDVNIIEKMIDLEGTATGS